MRPYPPFGPFALRTLSTLGIPTSHLARDSGMPDTEMLREIRRSGGMPAGSTAPSKGQFQRILKYYAELERRKHSQVSEEEQGVLLYLHSWFEFQKVLKMVMALDEALVDLTLPGGIEPAERPYRDLLTKVFRVHSVSSTPLIQWRNYLSRFVDCAIEDTPSSHEALVGGFIKERVAQTRSWVCPPWPPEVCEYIDYVLDKVLTPAALAVVRPTFGLGVAPQPMKEIAAGLQIPVSTARARCNQALKVLGHCTYTRELRRMVKSVPLNIVIPGKDPRLSILCQPIEALEIIVVRTLNCLHNANLRYIGEVVQCKETDLLKTGSFGRKSLRDLKERIDEYSEQKGISLSLGMTIDPELKTQLDQELQKLRQLHPSKKSPNSPSR